MIRWLSFCFGGLLLIITLFLRDYRANHPPDSHAFVVHTSNIHTGEQLLKIELSGRQTLLLQRDVLMGRIVHYTWSPNGQRLLVVLSSSAMRDSGMDRRDNEIYIVSGDGTQASKIYAADSLFNYPSWSQDSQEIYVAGYSQLNSRDSISVKRLSLTGEILAEYTLDVEVENYWSLGWVNEQTLLLTYTVNDDGGYKLDFSTGQISPNPGFVFPNGNNNLSPDSKWFLTGSVQRHTTLVKADSSREEVWTIPATQISVVAGLQYAWSSDSQWIVMRGNDGQSSPQASITDLYIVDVAGENIVRLTDDDRKKTLIMSDHPYPNAVYSPFSYNNGWLLYEDETNYRVSTVNVLATDGSQELRDLYGAVEHDKIASAKWSPPIDYPFNYAFLLLAGLSLVFTSLSLTIWQGRR